MYNEMKDSHLNSGWFDNVQRKVMNAPRRKNDLILVKWTHTHTHTQKPKNKQTNIHVNGDKN